MALSVLSYLDLAQANPAPSTDEEVIEEEEVDSETETVDTTVSDSSLAEADVAGILDLEVGGSEEVEVSEEEVETSTVEVAEEEGCYDFEEFPNINIDISLGAQEKVFGPIVDSQGFNVKVDVSVVVSGVYRICMTDLVTEETFMHFTVFAPQSFVMDTPYGGTDSINLNNQGAVSLAFDTSEQRVAYLNEKSEYLIIEG